MGFEVYLDRETGNAFVKHDGALHSVNAVLAPDAGRWTRHWGPPGGGARIFHGQVIDWRWRCTSQNTPAEQRAARYFGLEA